MHRQVMLTPDSGSPLRHGLLRAPALLLAAVALVPAAAQQPAEGGARQSLQEVVETYLATGPDKEAAALLEEILDRGDATPDALLAAVRRPVTDIRRSFTLRIPAAGSEGSLELVATVRTPRGHGRDGPRLPVVLDVGGGPVADRLPFGDAVTVFVPGFTPPMFSDAARDAFCKVLRVVAHAAHGDPGRLWLAGFSWAGHASWDTALHRPGVLRGLVPVAGGPRRVHFRLLPNLDGLVVRAVCGGRDDPELVWSLEELERSSVAPGMDYHLELVPDAGHTLDLQGVEAAARAVTETAARAPEIPESGELLADGPGVATPFLRIDRVVERRVRQPRRVRVRPGASETALRRAMLKALEDRVARLRWTLKERRAGKGEPAGMEVLLRPEGVRACTLFLRAGDFPPGARVSVRRGARELGTATLRPDRRVLLEEARRTGGRLRPVVQRIQLELRR